MEDTSHSSAMGADRVLRKRRNASEPVINANEQKKARLSSSTETGNVSSKQRNTKNGFNLPTHHEESHLPKFTHQNPLESSDFGGSNVVGYIERESKTPNAKSHSSNESIGCQQDFFVSYTELREDSTFSFIGIEQPPIDWISRNHLEEGMFAGDEVIAGSEQSCGDAYGESDETNEVLDHFLYDDDVSDNEVDCASQHFNEAPSESPFSLCQVFEESDNNIACTQVNSGGSFNFTTSLTAATSTWSTENYSKKSHDVCNPLTTHVGNVQVCDDFEECIDKIIIRSDERTDYSEIHHCKNTYESKDPCSSGTRKRELCTTYQGTFENHIGGAKKRRVEKVASLADGNRTLMEDTIKTTSKNDQILIAKNSLISANIPAQPEQCEVKDPEDLDQQQLSLQKNVDTPPSSSNSLKTLPSLASGISATVDLTRGLHIPNEFLFRAFIVAQSLWRESSYNRVINERGSLCLVPTLQSLGVYSEVKQLIMAEITANVFNSNRILPELHAPSSNQKAICYSNRPQDFNNNNNMQVAKCHPHCGFPNPLVAANNALLSQGGVNYISNQLYNLFRNMWINSQFNEATFLMKLNALLANIQNTESRSVEETHEDIIERSLPAIEWVPQDENSLTNAVATDQIVEVPDEVSATTARMCVSERQAIEASEGILVVKEDVNNNIDPIRDLDSYSDISQEFRGFETDSLLDNTRPQDTCTLENEDIANGVLNQLGDPIIKDVSDEDMIPPLQPTLECFDKPTEIVKVPIKAKLRKSRQIAEDEVHQRENHKADSEQVKRYDLRKRLSKRKKVLKAASATSVCEDFSSEETGDRIVESRAHRKESAVCYGKHLTDFNTVRISNAEFLRENVSDFEIITENEYHCQRIFNEKDLHMVCSCSVSSRDCGKRCLNRLVSIECDLYCKLSDRCTNRCFQQLQCVQCRLCITVNKGIGLISEVEIKKGKFMMEFVGEVLDIDGFEERWSARSHYYFVALQNDVILDCSAKGNFSRFINHSCDPNCEVQKWSVKGETRLGVFSRRRIMPGEEITIDYQYHCYSKGIKVQRCYCSAALCRGWIGKAPESVVVNEDSVDRDKQEVSRETTGCEETLLSAEKISKCQENKVKAKPRPNWKSNQKRFQMSMKDEALTSKEEKARRENLYNNGIRNQADVQVFTCLMASEIKNSELRLKLLSTLHKGVTTCPQLFLYWNGLSHLNDWLKQVTDNSEMLSILNILLSLPICNNQKIEQSNILSTLRNLRASEMFCDDENPNAVRIIQEIFHKWATLPEYFRIPKLQKTKEECEIPVNPIDEVNKCSETNRNASKFPVNKEDETLKPSFCTSKNYPKFRVKRPEKTYAQNRYKGFHKDYKFKNVSYSPQSAQYDNFKRFNNHPLHHYYRNTTTTMGKDSPMFSGMTNLPINYYSSHNNNVSEYNQDKRLFSPKFNGNTMGTDSPMSSGMTNLPINYYSSHTDNFSQQNLDKRVCLPQYNSAYQGYEKRNALGEDNSRYEYKNSMSPRMLQQPKPSTAVTDFVSEADSPNVSHWRFINNHEGIKNALATGSFEVSGEQKKPVAVNGISQINKTLQQLFCEEISETVHKSLQPYYRDTCAKGRIISPEDFTFLKNKLVQILLIKESKYVSSTGKTLLVTESVKKKSCEYIKAYMSKFGEVYVRKEIE